MSGLRSALRLTRGPRGHRAAAQGAEHRTPHLTHLGLHTTALVKSGWPYPSDELTKVVTGCVDLGIRVLIPELVLREAEAAWLHRTRDNFRRVQDILHRFSVSAPGLIDVSVLKWPEADQFASAYGTAVDALRERWQWVVVPPPGPSVTDLLTRPFGRKPPVVHDDTRCRDALIVESMLSPLKKGDVLGLIATGTDHLADPRVSAAAKSRGVKLVIYGG
jgi:hypothetical protein